MTIADFSIVTTVATAEVWFINLLVYGTEGKEMLVQTVINASIACPYDLQNEKVPPGG